ncbi:hypothetical protein ACIQWR_39865 [Streptomyces sp. NPDC098789]|uniref:hypothetical protein n=1 Tax=Streptomyces sp. NPDC098789 TaxID=3366098 RepID=UPI00381EF09C
MTTPAPEALRLEAALRAALQVAEIPGARVWPEGDALPSVRLFGPLPGKADHDALSVQAWLRRANTNGTAQDGGCSQVSIQFADVDAGHRLAEMLREPADRAQAAAGVLAQELKARQVGACVRGRADGRVTVEIPDPATEPAAMNLARALGASTIAKFLKLDVVEGAWEFTDRLRWLMIGVVGEGVTVDGRFGNEPRVSGIDIQMTPGQALSLVWRLK